MFGRSRNFHINDVRFDVQNLAPECFHQLDDFGTVDPTGCGNVSTAAVFWALCENRPLEEAGLIGGISAALNASHYGLIPRITPALRQQCSEMLREKCGQEIARRVKL